MLDGIGMDGQIGEATMKQLKELLYSDQIVGNKVRQW